MRYLNVLSFAALMWSVGVLTSYFATAMGGVSGYWSVFWTAYSILAMMMGFMGFLVYRVLKPKVAA